MRHESPQIARQKRFSTGTLQVVAARAHRAKQCAWHISRRYTLCYGRHGGRKYHWANTPRIDPAQHHATISGEFNSQGIANTLGAHATIGRKQGERVMGQLQRRTEAKSGELRALDLCECTKSFDNLRLFQECRVYSSATKLNSIKPSYKAAFIGQPVTAFASQQLLSDALRAGNNTFDDSCCAIGRFVFRCQIKRWV